MRTTWRCSYPRSAPECVRRELSIRPMAGSSRQPQVGGSRNDALFAGRQCQVRVVLRDHMIANQQDLTCTEEATKALRAVDAHIRRRLRAIIIPQRNRVSADR